MSTLPSISQATTGNRTKLVDLNTLNVPDGARYFVNTVSDWFRLDKSSTLTADGISIITPSGGPGRWIRENLPAPKWSAQATWFIDPSAGNDENDGLTNVTALKTFGEFTRRAGTPYRVSATQVDITVLGTTPFGDPLDLQIHPVVTSKIFFHGNPTVVSTNTFTAVTNLNRNTNTRSTVTRSGAPWTANIGKLIKDTSVSPAKYAFITAEPVSGTARTSRWLQFDPLTYASTPTLTDPTNGDTYQIISYPTITSATISFEGSLPNTTPLDTIVIFENLQLGLGSGSANSFAMINQTRNVIGVNNCIIGRSRFSGGAAIVMTNCYYTGQARVLARTDFACFGGVTSASGSIASEGGLPEFDFDFLFENNGNITFLADFYNDLCYIGCCGFFRTAGDGITINAGQTVFNTGDASGIAQMWGTGNPGRGIRVSPGGQFVYQKATPPIVNTGLGLGREIIIGDNDKLLSDLPYVEGPANAAAVAK